jgi:hypothetical protein
MAPYLITCAKIQIIFKYTCWISTIHNKRNKDPIEFDAGPSTYDSIFLALEET